MVPTAVSEVRKATAGDAEVVWAVVSEGYTAEESDRFLADVEELVAGVLAGSPYNEPRYRDCFTVHAIHVPSAQSGIDHPSLGIEVDTAFGATYGTEGMDRFLTCNQSRVLVTAFEAVPEADHVWVLCNADHGGGSAGRVITLDKHWAQDLIGIHEYGHLLAGLADEYETPRPGYPEDDYEANVTFQTQRSRIPWAAKIDDDTPIATPENGGRPWSTVGLFEGARYRSEGIYRPQLVCRMRSLSYRIGFCEVCHDAQVAALDRMLGLDPAPTGVASVTPHHHGHHGHSHHEHGAPCHAH